MFVEKQVVLVQVDRYRELSFGRADTCDVIDMGVREEDVTDRERFPVRECEQPGHLISRIDDDRLTRAFASHDEPVLEEGPHGLRLDYDHVVILAILDDLMFTSKIRLAANQLGVAVTFARSSDAALADMRKNSPALVILDLNNPRTDPLGTLAAMKADAALAGISTLGFVSHVDTGAIDAARQAGIGEVMARSAFAERLPDILARGK